METRIDLCPLAHRSLREELSRRCCTIDSFKQVFWCSLNDAGDLPTPGNHVRIEQVTDQTALLWAQVVAGSFSGVGRLEDADIRLPRVTPYTRNGVCFLAWIGDDPAGGGALTMQDGAAICYSTSVQPALRRMGVHTALLATRLRYALDAGCDLAVVQTSPARRHSATSNDSAFAWLIQKPQSLFSPTTPDNRPIRHVREPSDSLCSGQTTQAPSPGHG